MKTQKPQPEAMARPLDYILEQSNWALEDSESSLQDRLNNIRDCVKNEAVNEHAALTNLEQNARTIAHRLTNCARAFYVAGTPKELKKAFEGWKLEIEAFNESLNKLEEIRK